MCMCDTAVQVMVVKTKPKNLQFDDKLVTN